MRRLVLALVLLSLGACTSVKPPPLPAAMPGARTGGVIRVGIPTPGSIDPGNVYEPSGDLVARTLCTPLLAADTKHAELLPAIVESWLVTDGGAGLTLRIREGVRFSDGSPLGAEDVAFTLTRIASAEYASTSAERLELIAGYPEIHGDVPSEDEGARRRLGGVAIRDGLTVQISLRTPHADFLRVLASPLTAPVSKAAAEADPANFGRNPVCVGPYRLQTPYEPGADRLTLVRSRSYVPVDTSLTKGGRAYADSVEFRFYPSVEDAAAAWAAGEVDVAPAGSHDPPDVKIGPGPEIEYLGLPTTVAGFDDPVVRRALSLALDRGAVARVLAETRQPASGFFPLTAPEFPECPHAPIGGNVEAARALLAKRGADLRQLTAPLYFNDQHRHRAAAEAVAQQWRDGVGLTVVPTPLPPADYIARGEGRPGFDGPFRFSWSSTFSDIDGYLFPLFTTDRIGRDNFSRFSEPAFDAALLREARRAQDPDDRSIAFGRVAELLCEHMPMIPIATSMSRWAVAPRVGSASVLFLDGASGQPLLRELYLRS